MDFRVGPNQNWTGYINSVSLRGLTAITYNHLNLPENVSNAKEYQMQYIYDASGRKLNQTVTMPTYTKRTDYQGELIFQGDTLQFINHEEGRVVMTGSIPEYQYHLKDHLGNVRMTFTASPLTPIDTATVEAAKLTAEQAKFLNIDKARRVNAKIFDHTFNGVSTPNGAYSTRLTGSTNEKIGLARSLSVMPGDTIEVEVFAKYVDPNATNDNALTSVLAAIASGGSVPGGTYVDGSGYSTASSATYPFIGFLGHNDSGTAPKAYLNYVVFDRKFAFKDGGFVRITTAAKETGDVTNHTGLAYEGASHERLAFEGSTSLKIKEAGYVYIWLSNEETTPVEVLSDLV